MLIQPIGIEEAVTANSNVAEANYIFISNDNQGAGAFATVVLYSAATSNAVGSLTIPPDSTFTMFKGQKDWISCSVSCNVSPVKVIV